jgi:hypothetical protein
MTVKIPTYASDGRRIRAYSLDAIEHLLSLSLIVVKRNRHGKILAAHFRPQDGSNPLRATASMGQRYSFHAPVGNDGMRAWTHKQLIQRQDLEALLGLPLDNDKELDLYIRGIFRSVALSVMQRGPEPDPPAPAPAKAKVVSIDSGRRKPARPIEFDSQRRAA